MGENSFTLSEDDKCSLLRLARQSLKTWVREKRTMTVQELQPFREREILNTNAGAFVTIHNKGELRGCIGSVQADMPLYETVASMAVSAASNDPRFFSVRADELADIDLEISVLSPMEPTDPDDVVPGVHGLLLSHQRGRGLLLPQVATEYGWSREEFLQHTARKAGLPMNAWKEAEVFTFTATVFSEKELQAE